MIKSILKHSSKYFSTSIFTAGLSFLMLKYYTAVLTPEEFGIFSMYFIMVQYLALLVFFNDGGFNIMYFKTNNKKEYINMNISFMLLLSLVLILFSLMLMPFIVPFIADNTYDIFIVSLVVGLGAGFIKMFYRILINEELSSSHMKSNIYQALANHGFSFLLMALFNLGVMGRQLGQLIGQTFSLFQVRNELKKKLKFNFTFTKNFTDLKETFHLAWPIFLSSLMVIVFSYTDRIFLNHFSGLEKVGIYTLGFTIGQSLLMINEAISLAFYPKVMNLLKQDFNQNITIIQKYNIGFMIVLIFVASILALNSKLLVGIISNKNYVDSSTIIPLIFMSFLFGGFYKIPSMILSHYKITKFYPILSFIAFGLNAVLNYMLIPQYGLMGAAIATGISSIIYSIYINYRTFEYIKSFFYKIQIIILYLLSIIIFYVITNLIGTN
jgi:O-antigen/teichoic acid export membrane protein